MSSPEATADAYKRTIADQLVQLMQMHLQPTMIVVGVDVYYHLRAYPDVVYLRNQQELFTYRGLPVVFSPLVPIETVLVAYTVKPLLDS